MALINRLSRLFQADLHAVLDRIEEPDVLLKQAVREMEDELAACEQRIHCMQQHQQQLLQREADIEQSLLRIEEELGICFESGNDKLVRGLVKRKLEAQLFLKSVVRKRGTLEKTLREQSIQCEENRTQFESMRQKSELLAEEIQAAAARRDDPFTMTMAEFSIRDDEVEVAMLREKQQYEKRRKS